MHGEHYHYDDYCDNVYHDDYDDDANANEDGEKERSKRVSSVLHGEDCDYDDVDGDDDNDDDYDHSIGV